MGCVVVCLLGLLSGCGGGSGGGGGAGAASCPAIIAHSGSTLTTGDPLYAYQWHLKNMGQSGGSVGDDVDVEPAWSACSDDTCRGEGVRVAVVDDGLEIAHEDLAANVAVGASHDYVSGCSDPTGGDHGTAVAGLVAARDGNGVGGRGVAPRANIVGFNLLQSYSLSNEVDAMTRDLTDVQVSSNSWGPPDGYGTLDASSQSWKDAIETGLRTGRNGKGTIYVWAGGNGAPTDNANYDGYANYRGVIGVCAVGDDGTQAWYSERGANLWVCAPSEGNDYHAITTTDRSGALGFNAGSRGNDYPDANYTDTFNGTSAATPMVSGVVALMLQANPSLSWREVRLLLAQTARKNDATNFEWRINGAGYHVNPRYGFGVVDAAAAVTAAKAWTTPLPAQRTFVTALATPGMAIPDNDTVGASATLNVSGSGISHLEWVEVTFSADHARSGDLAVTLTAPSGTRSELAAQHGCPTGCTAYNGWVFGDARDLGEGADGVWTLRVKDLASGTTGTFRSWRLKLYGY